MLGGDSARRLSRSRLRGTPPSIDADRRRRRQKQWNQLCQLIVDAGYPLGKEMWLSYDFADVLLGRAGPVEFRDLDSRDVPDDIIDAARLAFESLKRQRRNPLTLKSLARLAIRRSIMENPCLRCRLDVYGKTVPEGLVEDLNLFPKLRDFVTFNGLFKKCNTI